MRKKVLLVFPNTANWAAISMAIPILGGIAKSKKWDVDYFDTYKYKVDIDSTTDKETTGGFKAGLSRQKQEFYPKERLITDLQKKISEGNPDIIALNAMSHEFEFLLTFWPQLNIPQNSYTIIGGIHATLKPEDVIQTGYFDLVCIGEGEWTFAEILERFNKGQRIDDIQNTFFRNRESGEITRNSRRKLLTPEELWRVKNDYSMYDDPYFEYPFDGKMIRRFIVETARGCPYNCTYCGNSALKNANKGLGEFVITRPMDSIFNHLKEIKKSKNIDIFLFAEECFLAHPIDWLEEFAERYREVGLPFIIQTRPETVSEKRIDIVKSAGAPFFQVSIGVESGSERILFDVCNRKTKIQQIRAAFDILHKHQIRCSAFFMLGFPYETREDIFKTVELCRKIHPSVMSVSIYQPLPGQELTDECIAKGFITGSEPMATFTSNSILKMPQISSEEITNLRQVFALYSSLPRKYFHEIEKCEKDYENHRDLFEQLVEIRWKLADNPDYIPD